MMIDPLLIHRIFAAIWLVFIVWGLIQGIRTGRPTAGEWMTAVPITTVVMMLMSVVVAFIITGRIE